jgi:diguanylate cyclase (GGDEF)-like protein
MKVSDCIKHPVKDYSRLRHKIVVRKIVAPLKKIADASAKLSNGDYNVEFAKSDILEIELLNMAFENMAMRLRERERELRFFANRDSLTGLRNVTSYKSWETEFDKTIENQTAKFGVVVLDLNWLKETNDTYGHDVGDKVIAAAAKAISDVFKRSPVFRIGGDEFLVVLQNKDLENCDELLSLLDFRCQNTFITDSQDPIRLAVGFSRFDSDKDLRFADVFERADNAMYENKRRMKSNESGLDIV